MTKIIFDIIFRELRHQITVADLLWLQTGQKIPDVTVLLTCEWVN
jgi:hypothetical protein